MPDTRYRSKHLSTSSRYTAAASVGHGRRNLGNRTKAFSDFKLRKSVEPSLGNERDIKLQHRLPFARKKEKKGEEHRPSIQSRSECVPAVSTSTSTRFRKPLPHHQGCLFPAASTRSRRRSFSRYFPNPITPYL